MSTYLPVILVCFSGGLLSGLAGFGSLVIIVPGLLLWLEAELVVPLGILCGLATQTANVVSFHTHIRWRELFRMVVGSVPGMWLGTAVLAHVSEITLRALLGMLLLCYAVFSLSGRITRGETSPRTAWAYVAGFCSGALGGAFGINGPPAVVYATRTGWSPDAIRGFVSTFCAIVFMILSLNLWMRGMMGVAVWRQAVPAVVSSLLGGVAGRWLARRFREKNYLRLVYTLLLVMGLSLIWPALRLLAPNA